MKGKFDAYVLWPLTKRVQNWIVDRSTAPNFMLELQSKIVIFQNVNKHWWAHLEKPLEETIQSHWGPSGIHQCTIGAPLGVCQGSFRCQLRALQMTSPNNLSKWALQCLFTFWNITILDCNSNYLVLYSILFFDTNVYNEYWLTSYYQWL